MIRPLLSISSRTARHFIHSTVRLQGPSALSIPTYRNLSISRFNKMPSEKADPTTEILPAEQANPAAPAPNVGADGAAAPATTEGGENGEDGKPSKKGGKRVCLSLVDEFC